MTIPDLNTTAYTGVKQRNPPNIRYFTKDPTPFDNVGFDIGDFWINTSVPQSWQLMSKSAGIVGTHQTAAWELMGSAVSGVFQLTPDGGGAVTAIGGNINLHGTNGIQTANGGAGQLDITNTSMFTPGSDLAVGFVGGNINLVEGNGIAITNNGAGSIRFDVVSSGFTWNSITAATNPNPLVAENGYVPTGGAQVIFSLPVAPAFGDVIEIVGIATGNLWKITQNAGQTIRLGIQSTTPGVLGHLDATMVTDSVKLLCVVPVTTFEIISVTGNPNFN